MDTDADISKLPQDELAQLRKRMAEFERTETTIQRLNEVACTLSASLDLATLIPKVVRLTFYEAAMFARYCHATLHMHRRSALCDLPALP
jgi:hypothetical protein